MMGSAAASAKKVLRSELKKKLSTMTPKQKELESKAITQFLLSSPIYQKSQHICVYLSMSSEVDTSLVIKDIFEKKKACYVPWYSPDTMKFLRLDSLEDYESLPLTAWKIKQPTDRDAEIREEALESGNLDLVIVPGLGFGDNGSRLGRGKGYYDRYLAKCSKKTSQVTTIGLSFSRQWCPKDSAIPMDQYDLPLHYIITPDAIKAFGEQDSHMGI